MREPDARYAPFEAAGRAALAEWGLDGAPLTLVSHAENVVFRVDAGAHQRFVLRIHRPWYHDYEELVSEQWWTAAMLEAGIDVPVPRSTFDGQAYATVRVPGTDGEHLVGLVEWVDGAPMSEGFGDGGDREVLTRCFRQVGHIAARIHEHGIGWSPPAGFRRHAFDAEGLMGESPFWGRFWANPELADADRDLVQRLRERIRWTLHDYGKDPSTYGLIHADLHPGNVIVNGPRLHVIDFDDGGFGWHQYELAVALFCYQDNPHFEAIRDALVAGYRARRDFDDAALALLPMFLVIRALALVGWVADRPELSQRPALADLMGSVRRNARAAFGDTMVE